MGRLAMRYGAAARKKFETKKILPGPICTGTADFILA
jgi:hypothetical protein